jgi:hypothetical protein
MVGYQRTLSFEGITNIHFSMEQVKILSSVRTNKELLPKIYIAWLQTDKTCTTLEKLVSEMAKNNWNHMQHSAASKGFKNSGPGITTEVLKEGLQLDDHMKRKKKRDQHNVNKF